jgi:hypothetical protein
MIVIRICKAHSQPTIPSKVHGWKQSWTFPGGKSLTAFLLIIQIGMQHAPYHTKKRDKPSGQHEGDVVRQYFSLQSQVYSAGKKSAYVTRCQNLMPCMQDTSRSHPIESMKRMQKMWIAYWNSASLSETAIFWNWSYLTGHAFSHALKYDVIATHDVQYQLLLTLAYIARSVANSSILSQKCFDIIQVRERSMSVLLDVAESWSIATSQTCAPPASRMPRGKMAWNAFPPPHENSTSLPKQLVKIL